MSGRHYTWVGAGDNPTFEKLDKVLVSTDWEDKFPLSTVQSRDRDIFDHTPLVLNTGASTHAPIQRPFKFERGWLIRDGFYDMVVNIWQSDVSGRTPLERWQNKIRRLRQHLRGWAKHTAGTYRKEKKKLLALLENLDKRAELAPLSDQEINYKHYLKERLVLLLREEEIKWYERAKVKTFLVGDDNTRFFHLVANGKHRKQHIYKLENDQGVVIGDDQLKSHITQFYKNLFGTPDMSKITLMENQILDIPQVSQEENDVLISEFTETEVKDAVFQMEHNKAPGPYGFPVEFYQVF